MFPGRQILSSAVGAKRYFSLSKSTSWKKSSPVHVTAILVGCVAFEFFYGVLTDSIWESLNKGVSYSILFYLLFFILCRNSFTITRWTNLN
jgi:hypothetical protein